LVRVALERQSIEKKDFPIGRRGYDPDAVDAHLRSLAEEVDELKRSARRRTETLASSASEQVRSIVEAAESSAADIQQQAEEEAREIRAEASGEAQAAREQATSQAREYVGKVSESTSVMLQRLDAMESELSALIESLRTGSNRLNADLQLLEGNLTEVSGAVVPRPRFEPEPRGAVLEEPPAAEGSDLFQEQADVELEAAAVTYEEVVVERAGEPAAVSSLEPEPPDGSDDTEGARLIALNMALNGTPRAETERYLAENFQLSDRRTLLDEVYASVEG
jgi:DivIVA domain-containing protein